jgi:hypothetical protein
LILEYVNISYGPSVPSWASGFDASQPWGEQALRGAEFGRAKMLKQLAAVVAGLAADR